MQIPAGINVKLNVRNEYWMSGCIRKRVNVHPLVFFSPRSVVKTWGEGLKMLAGLTLACNVGNK